MKKRKRKKGEQEVRILPDGRVVLVAPDQVLLDVGQTLASENQNTGTNKKRKDHDREQTLSDTSSGPEESAAGRSTAE